MDGLRRGQNALRASHSSGTIVINYHRSTESFSKERKIIILASLREETFTKIHVGHMGMEECKPRTLFWPVMCK
jgi:hypothetical protein